MVNITIIMCSNWDKTSLSSEKNCFRNENTVSQQIKKQKKMCKVSRNFLEEKARSLMLLGFKDESFVNK